MRTWQLKYLLLVIATIFFLTACDGSSGLVSPTKKDPDTSVQPGEDILPYTPPKDGAPLEDFGDGNGGGGGGGNGGGSGHGGSSGDDGGDQQPVPEPSSLILVGSGVALITLCRRKKLLSEKKDG